MSLFTSASQGMSEHKVVAEEAITELNRAMLRLFRIVQGRVSHSIWLKQHCDAQATCRPCQDGDTNHRSKSCVIDLLTTQVAKCLLGYNWANHTPASEHRQDGDTRWPVAVSTSRPYSFQVSSRSSQVASGVWATLRRCIPSKPSRMRPLYCLS